MNQKGFANIILVIIIVIFVGLIGYLAFVRKLESPPVTQTPSPTIEETELTNEIVLSLLKNYLPLPNGECLPEGVAEYYRSCNINIAKENNQWMVVLTVDGLYDDSVRAMRINTTVIYDGEQWSRGEIFRSQKCWPGRGHQDFSTKLCI